MLGPLEAELHAQVPRPALVLGAENRPLGLAEGAVVRERLPEAAGRLVRPGEDFVRPATRKLNSSGATVFTKAFGTASYDDAREVATRNGSEIFITGATKGPLVPYQGGENDAYVRKLRSAGNPVWTR